MEAAYLLLAFLSDPRSAGVKARVLALMSELNAIPNYDVAGAWADGAVVANSAWSHVFEGLIKGVSRGLMAYWNEKVVDAKVAVRRTTHA